MSTLLNRLFHRSQEPVKECELSPALKRDDRVARIALSMDTVGLADRFYREHATQLPFMLGKADEEADRAEQ